MEELKSEGGFKGKARGKLQVEGLFDVSVLLVFGGMEGAGFMKMGGM